MASPSLMSPSTYPSAPPPPPKPTPQTPTTTAGPPLPPPPPSQTPTSTNTQPHPPPPEPSDHWLPPALLDKSSQTLEAALQNQHLIHSLSLLHPSLTPSPLPPHLQQVQNLAQHLTSQYERLLSLRQQTQTHLLQLHALERQWREKQAHMDQELAPWSAKVLYQRLREGEREGEEWCAGLERSWLDDGSGEMGEREVGEFLRGYREGRVKVWRRKEARERWDEGRVGGWR